LSLCESVKYAAVRVTVTSLMKPVRGGINCSTSTSAPVRAS
jgi:hypothetical protein